MDKFLRATIKLLVVLVCIMLIIGTAPFFGVHLLLWLILRKRVNPNNIFWEAYSTTIKVICILILVGVIAFGMCMGVMWWKIL